MSASLQTVSERTPALTVAFALVTGILCDRWIAPDWRTWAVLSIATFGTATLLSLVQRWQAAAAVLLLFVCCVGGLRHHSVWALRRDDDVSRFASEQPQPVELVGVVRTPVEIRAADQSEFTPSWMRYDRSVCEVACEWIVSEGDEIPASGRIRLEVTGHLLHAHVGDRVRIVGELLRPAPVRNPGGFDFRAYLRDRGIDCIVRSNHPDAVVRLASEPGWGDRVARRRHRLRSECRAILTQYVERDRVPIAASILLGDRTGMNDDLRAMFAESGTMHLLAISGLHVGILAGMLYLLCRVVYLSPVGTAVLVITGVLAYAFVTDHRPPVLRATVMAILFVCALPLMRRTSLLNILALSAIMILLVSPTDLFSIGAQLSFLAVLGISGAASLLSRQRRSAAADPLAPERARWVQSLRPLGEWARQGYVLTGAIWLFTLPLTMARFHLASPVGFLINVLMIPYTAALLFFGFLLLFCGLLVPWLAAVPGVAFDSLLGGLMWIVETASGSLLGHVYLPGPPVWWLAGWYAGLALAGGVVRFPAVSRHAWQILAGWTCVGLAWGLAPAEREVLKCTFLSVGHGCAIVLELPEGGTLVCDAGAFGAPGRAQDAVQNALWEAGRSRIDGLIVTHADTDHFNAVSRLAETVPIGGLFVSQPSLDFSQPSVAVLCENAAAAGIPIRIIHAGDRLRSDPEVEIEVLHPPPGPGDIEDNANSVVLRITYAGRTILLTGDLDGPGLDALLETEPFPVDVLLSPHHGSAAANPPELAAWAKPEVVVVSTGHPGVPERLRPAYGETTAILSTEESGAVTCFISRDGGLKFQETFMTGSADLLLTAEPTHP